METFQCTEITQTAGPWPRQHANQHVNSRVNWRCRVRTCVLIAAAPGALLPRAAGLASGFALAAGACLACLRVCARLYSAHLLAAWTT